MKKLLVFALIIGVVFGFTSISLAQDFEMTVALSEPMDSEMGVASEEFKRLIEERTDGQITVKLYPNEQLGKEVDAISGMQMGTIDMGVFGTTIYKQAAPKYNIWSAYYLFESTEELLYVLNSEIAEEMNQAMIENKDIRIIGYGLRGPRMLTTNYPVEEPADVDGLDIRVPLQDLYVESWKALGAQPTTIAYSELYSALRQGLVDAQENPLANIYASSLYEVQDYVNVTEHQRAFYTYAVSNKFYNRLPENLQEIVIQTGKDVTEFHKNMQQENHSELKQQLKDEGMEFVEVDQSAFKEELSHIPEMFADAWAPNLYQRIQEKVEEFHEQNN